MNRLFVTCICALVALGLTISAQVPTRATGDQRRQYVFAPTGQQMPYRIYVPKTWDGKVSLPIILMLHGAGANESTYLDQADGLLMKLAEQHGYIVVSPLGFSPLGAYGNPLRLPAVFGQPAAAASQRAAVTPVRQRELTLSELEVMTALEIVTEEYGADRSRTYLAGHSMGSGGAWHLAARYPERWRAVAPMSGPFVDEATYPFDRIRRLPIFMTEGTGATPSLEGSRVLARDMRERGFAFEYLEVDGNHGSMVPMVWPRIFEFFNRQGQAPAPPPRATGPGPHGVTAESYPTLATHTAYHPTNLDEFGPSNRLPIVSWGNGACARNGSAFSGFLTQIASHGYLAISVGPKNPPSGPAPAPTIDDQLLLDAIDWAVRQNGDRSSRFHDKLDTTRIAVMGQSCGGLQALAVSYDPRITTTVVWNSGALPPGSASPALKQSAGNKDSLTRLHGPVAYFIGGPTDVAYPNAEDDFARISKVPVFKGNLNVGHGGTYRQAGGGRFGEVAVAWLDYQLKGSAEAARWFVGVDCRLCTDPLWAIEKKGMR
ncbi:MAG: alpha/beta hydrolase-fold protein [Acidobacteriota bacterium]